MAHLVTAALAVIRDVNGRSTYFYQGGYIPDGLAESGEIDRLTRLGLLTQVADIAPEPVPAEDDVQVPTDGQDPGGAPATSPVPVRPQQAAAKGLWVEHVLAVAEHYGDEDMTRERADAMNKDQLIAYTPAGAS